MYSNAYVVIVDPLKTCVCVCILETDLTEYHLGKQKYNVHLSFATGKEDLRRGDDELTMAAGASCGKPTRLQPGPIAPNEKRSPLPCTFPDIQYASLA